MKKIVLIISLLCVSLVGCGENKAVKKTDEVSVVQGQYAINVSSYEELAGFADYVIVGKVIEELETEYRGKIEAPYTHYRIEVIENIKGCLTQDSPIIISKSGGLTKDGKKYEVFEQDLLPESGEEYVFYISTRKDGSNVVSGKNSTIPIGNMQNTKIHTISESRMTELESDDLLDKIRAGVENQIVYDKERSVSNDDVSAK